MIYLSCFLALAALFIDKCLMLIKCLRYFCMTQLKKKKF